MPAIDRSNDDCRYKLKCVGTAAVFKAIVTKTTSVEFATYAKPWLGTVIATTLWDGLIAHCIINQAQIRGIGVYSSVEVFNELMDMFFNDGIDGIDGVSTFGRIQICRSVGVAIVKHGAMFPSMELLLRHAIQYLGMRGKRVVCEPGTLDNEAAFLQGLFPGKDEQVTRKDGTTIAFTGLKPDEVKVVLCVHLLAFVLDGDLASSEMELWKLACHVRFLLIFTVLRLFCDFFATDWVYFGEQAAGPGLAVYDPGAVKALCVRFRGLQPIAVTDILACFDPSKVRTEENQKVPFEVKVREFFHDMEACLAV